TASSAYAPIPTRSVGYAPQAAAVTPPTAAPSPLGQDRFVPSTAYAASAPPYGPTSAYAPNAAYVPAVPKILTLEDIPGTPERMKMLTKQVMAPYFESISMALRTDPVIAQASYYGVQTDAEKLALVERVK